MVHRMMRMCGNGVVVDIFGCLLRTQFCDCPKNPCTRFCLDKMFQSIWISILHALQHLQSVICYISTYGISYLSNMEITYIMIGKLLFSVVLVDCVKRIDLVEITYTVTKIQYTH